MGIERDSIPTSHETHVFATVIRFFHCFKIGSYKFLEEEGSVYWLNRGLNAYFISLFGAIRKKMLFPIPFRLGQIRKAIAVNSLLIVSCS